MRVLCSLDYAQEGVADGQYLTEKRTSFIGFVRVFEEGEVAKFQEVCGLG